MISFHGMYSVFLKRTLVPVLCLPSRQETRAMCFVGVLSSWEKSIDPVNQLHLTFLKSWGVYWETDVVSLGTNYRGRARVSGMPPWAKEHPAYTRAGWKLPTPVFLPKPPPVLTQDNQLTSGEHSEMQILQAKPPVLVQWAQYRVGMFSTVQRPVQCISWNVNQKVIEAYVFSHNDNWNLCAYVFFKELKAIHIQYNRYPHNSLSQARITFQFTNGK